MSRDRSNLINVKMAIGLAVLIATASIATPANAQQGPVGVARISDSHNVRPVADAEPQPAAPPVADAAVDDGAPIVEPVPAEEAEPAAVEEYSAEEFCDCKVCRRARNDRAGMGGWWCNQKMMFYNRNRGESARLNCHLQCKFGYFIPTGCCGEGCPLAGTYKMVYAVDPYYTNDKDGQLYSAQGYGTPMAVPLAPNVRYTYNYSWGLPGSRLTPISRMVP